MMDSLKIINIFKHFWLPKLYVFAKNNFWIISNLTQKKLNKIFVKKMIRIEYYFKT